jgi:P pilus assembly chaperone PapD
VIAGETAQRKIYVYNNTNYYLNVDLELEGENAEISKTITQIAPNQTEEVEFKLTPDVTLMQPIKAQLKIKINYLVR